MDAINELVESDVPIATACDALAFPRATYYRLSRPDEDTSPPLVRPPRPPSHRALSDDERREVLDVLHSERFCDSAPRQVYGTLLEEGRYLCSVRTMYRILAQAGESRERRNQLTHPSFVPPSLCATTPNQVWSWDITKLKGPTKWNFLHLYVIIDIFSRYVVGWMVADRECSELAAELIQTACDRQRIRPDELTLHADRGPSMTSKTVAQLLADLGIEKSHSRPRVSDDNAFSEAQFKTLKYHRDFPQRFESIGEARAFLTEFFDWYNHEHKHSGIALFSPHDVHADRIDELRAVRQAALDEAYEQNPERFARRPIAASPPTRVILGPELANVIELPVSTEEALQEAV